jgi:hypothetical protein
MSNDLTNDDMVKLADETFEANPVSLTIAMEYGEFAISLELPGGKGNRTAFDILCEDGEITMSPLAKEICGRDVYPPDSGKGCDLISSYLGALFAEGVDGRKSRISNLVKMEFYLGNGEGPVSFFTEEERSNGEDLPGIVVIVPPSIKEIAFFSSDREPLDMSKALRDVISCTVVPDEDPEPESGDPDLLDEDLTYEMAMTELRQDDAPMEA